MKMKTKEEILNKHNPAFNISGNREYFTKEILDAMEEYAAQFQQEAVSDEWIKVSDRSLNDNNDYFITDGYDIGIGDHNNNRGWSVRGNNYFEPTHFKKINLPRK